MIFRQNEQRPLGLEAVILKCLAKSADNRPLTAALLDAELAACAADAAYGGHHGAWPAVAYRDAPSLRLLPWTKKLSLARRRLDGLR